jgi:hypothetical protein
LGPPVHPKEQINGPQNQMMFHGPNRIAYAFTPNAAANEPNLLKHYQNFNSHELLTRYLSCYLVFHAYRLDSFLRVSGITAWSTKHETRSK